MGRHEIRLRRHKMTSRRIEGHKNYYDVMKKHQRGNRMKRLLKMILLVFFFVLLLGAIYLTSKLLADKESSESTIYNSELISRPDISINVKCKTTNDGKTKKT